MTGDDFSNLHPVVVIGLLTEVIVMISLLVGTIARFILLAVE